MPATCKYPYWLCMHVLRNITPCTGDIFIPKWLYYCSTNISFCQSTSTTKQLKVSLSASTAAAAFLCRRKQIMHFKQIRCISMSSPFCSILADHNDFLYEMFNVVWDIEDEHTRAYISAAPSSVSSSSFISFPFRTDGLGCMNLCRVVSCVQVKGRRRRRRRMTDWLKLFQGLVGWLDDDPCVLQIELNNSKPNESRKATMKR